MRLSDAALSLPLGSKQSKVMALFKSEGVDYVHYEDKESIDGTSDVLNNGYSSASLGSFGGAGLHYTSYRVFPVFARYTFFFDKKGKLLKATVKHMTPAL